MVLDFFELARRLVVIDAVMVSTVNRNAILSEASTSPGTCWLHVWLCVAR